VSEKGQFRGRCDQDTSGWTKDASTINTGANALCE
jgi:hypothetical protein